MELMTVATRTPDPGSGGVTEVVSSVWRRMLAWSYIRTIKMGTIEEIPLSGVVDSMYPWMDVSAFGENGEFFFSFSRKSLRKSIIA